MSASLINFIASVFLCIGKTYTDPKFSCLSVFNMELLGCGLCWLLFLPPLGVCFLFQEQQKTHAHHKAITRNMSSTTPPQFRVPSTWCHERGQLESHRYLVYLSWSCVGHWEKGMVAMSRKFPGPRPWFSCVSLPPCDLSLCLLCRNHSNSSLPCGHKNIRTLQLLPLYYAWVPKYHAEWPMFLLTGSCSCNYWFTIFCFYWQNLQKICPARVTIWL